MSKKLSRILAVLMAFFAVSNAFAQSGVASETLPAGFSIVNGCDWSVKNLRQDFNNDGWQFQGINYANAYKGYQAPGSTLTTKNAIDVTYGNEYIVAINAGLLHGACVKVTLGDMSYTIKPESKIDGFDKKQWYFSEAMTCSASEAANLVLTVVYPAMGDELYDPNGVEIRLYGVALLQKANGAVDPDPETPVDPDPETPVDPDPETPVDPDPDFPEIPDPDDPYAKYVWADVTVLQNDVDGLNNSNWYEFTPGVYRLAITCNNAYAVGANIQYSGKVGQSLIPEDTEVEYGEGVVVYSPEFYVTATSTIRFAVAVDADDPTDYTVAVQTLKLAEETPVDPDPETPEEQFGWIDVTVLQNDVDGLNNSNWFEFTPGTYRLAITCNNAYSVGANIQYKGYVGQRLIPEGTEVEYGEGVVVYSPAFEVTENSTIRFAVAIEAVDPTDFTVTVQTYKEGGETPVDPEPEYGWIDVTVLQNDVDGLNNSNWFDFTPGTYRLAITCNNAFSVGANIQYKGYVGQSLIPEGTEVEYGEGVVVYSPAFEVVANSTIRFAVAIEAVDPTDFTVTVQTYKEGGETPVDPDPETPVDPDPETPVDPEPEYEWVDVTVLKNDVDGLNNSNWFEFTPGIYRLAITCNNAFSVGANIQYKGYVGQSLIPEGTEVEYGEGVVVYSPAFEVTENSTIRFAVAIEAVDPTDFTVTVQTVKPEDTPVDPEPEYEWVDVTVLKNDVDGLNNSNWFEFTPGTYRLAITCNNAYSVGANIQYKGYVGQSLIPEGTEVEFGEGVVVYSPAFEVVANSTIRFAVAIEAVDPTDFTVTVQTIKSVEAYEFNLVDGEAYTNDTEFVGVDVTYTRNFTSTNWQALYVPFNMPYEAWSEVAKVAQINTIHRYDTAEGEVTIIEFTAVESGELLPNVPYVIKPFAAGEVTFKAEDATLAAAANGSVWCASTTRKFTLTGIYEEKTDMATSGAYAMANGAFVQASSDAQTLAPYRVYLTIESVNNGYGIAEAQRPAMIHIMIDGEFTDGIEGIILDGVNADAIYDLNGRRVVNPAAGVYIQNGQKVYIK